jgi:hypothetical protein
MRILEGPSTNPEPPPEGLSPPMARELDSNLDSEAGEGALPPALYGLPSELREPPPGWSMRHLRCAAAVLLALGLLCMGLPCLLSA